MIPRCLTIAGSDSGGGAGIQADLKVFHALGCFGSSALTCLTAQNTYQVKSVFPVSPFFIAEQMDAVFEDIGSDAVKVGMLFDQAVMEAVADKLTAWKKNCDFRLVVDPVMISKSGVPLMAPSAVQFFKEKFLPLADILTPNLPEASALLGIEISSSKQMELAAQEIAKMGVTSVLLKGGHLDNSVSCRDYLWTDGAGIWFESQRIVSKNTHGTGCTLSAAICSFLAKKNSIKNSIHLAKKFLTEALQAGRHVSLGQGYGPAFFGDKTSEQKEEKI